MTADGPVIAGSRLWVLDPQTGAVRRSLSVGGLPPLGALTAVDGTVSYVDVQGRLNVVR